MTNVYVCHRRRATAIVFAASMFGTICAFPTMRPPQQQQHHVSLDFRQHHNYIIRAIPLYSSPDGNNQSSGSNSGRRSRRKKPSITDKNLYSILGATPTMSRTELKRMYVTLAKQTHPDSAMDAESSTVDRFNEIAQAWTILSDPKTRRAYDRELAAEDFKDDIVKKAGEVAREYGPTARKIYEDFAIPLLKRTTATTVASWNAVTEVTSSSEREKTSSGTIQPAESAAGGGAYGRNNSNANGKKLSGAKLSDVVKEPDALEDFGKAFQRVIEAGRNATRQIDGMELQEKSIELQQRADQTKAESMEVLKRLTEIKSERLRLTFRTSSADFTSQDATQYFEGLTLGENSGRTLMQRINPMNHPVTQDLENFIEAETEYQEKFQEKTSVDQQLQTRQRELQQAEQDAISAMQAEERARKMLEEAQRQLDESQKRVAIAQQSIRDLDVSVKRTEYDLTKTSTMLKKQRDIVRRELRKKAEKVEGTIFDQTDSGKVRLNPDFDKSSMKSMGFEDQSLETIEALRRDERRIERDFNQLADKASRLVSRSETLRIRSDELIGKQQMENDSYPGNNQGISVGD